VEQDRRVEVNSLCGEGISKKINNKLHIFKNTLLGINCMVKFLPIFKGKKAIGFIYMILVTLRQQVF